MPIKEKVKCRGEYRDFQSQVPGTYKAALETKPVLGMTHLSFSTAWEVPGTLSEDEKPLC